MHHPSSRTLTGFAALAALTTSVTLAEEGSELPDGSVVIDTFPFIATGDTSDNLDDFDAVCPWESDAPDVFYAITPDNDPPSCELTWNYTLSLCESAYDTKVFVLDEAFNVIACNDDFCTSSGGGQFRSALNLFQVPKGQTVYIGIDGWSGDSGVYELIVDRDHWWQGCVIGIPDGSVSEAEPCLDADSDLYNAGCDGATQQLFESVQCGDLRYGTISHGDHYRDTDWYELTTDHATTVTVSGAAEFNIIYGRVDEGNCAAGAPSCACISGTIEPMVTPADCECSSVSSPVAAGRSWWYVGSATVGALNCDGGPPTATGNTYSIGFECATMSCCSAGDADANGDVNFDDLLVMLTNWGECSSGDCCALGDANDDGSVGFADVVVLLANWGPCG